MAVGDDGAVALADALLNNPNSAVRILHLSWNNINTKGAVALAKALDGPTSKLSELNLQNNRGIVNDGAVALMRVRLTDLYTT